MDLIELTPRKKVDLPPPTQDAMVANADLVGDPPLKI